MNRLAKVLVVLGIITFVRADALQYKAGGGRRYPIISMDGAKAAALKARPGKVIFSSLKGAQSHPVYIFTILNRRIVYQVLVDARDGHIIRITEKANV